MSMKVKSAALTIFFAFCLVSTSSLHAETETTQDSINQTLELACRYNTMINDVQSKIDDLPNGHPDLEGLIEQRNKIIKYVHYNLRNMLAMQYHEFYGTGDYDLDDWDDVNNTFEKGFIPRSYVGAAKGTLDEID